MSSENIRKLFLEFFQANNHQVVPSSSLIPEEDDISVLFTTAGMQQFKPYFLGLKNAKDDFGTKRLCSIQKCLRTSDIEKVGKTPRHLTFFEMLGNFSFGDYFKKEAIDFALELLIKKFSLSKERIWVTVFKGSRVADRDEEAINYWQERGISQERIFEFGEEDNFWGPAGKNGPCGPCSEIHYDLTKKPCSKGKQCGPNCECGRFIEIWNLVFMQYFKLESGKYELLSQPSIDTGMGLERIAIILQNKTNVFETDLFSPFIEELKLKSQEMLGIIADHLRASVFLISEGILPSNVERGYILRRFIRRIWRYGRLNNLGTNFYVSLVQKIVKQYQNFYPQLNNQENDIISVIQREVEKFAKGLEKGEKALKKITVFSGKEAFYFYESYGLPLELTIEILKEQNRQFDEERIKSEFSKEFKKHQEISRGSAEKKFGGHGLINNQKLFSFSPEEQKIIRLHTATHLLLRALREILDANIIQKGSDINSERLRLDFPFPRKLTLEELKKVEDLVNQKIKDNLQVKYEETTYEKAIAEGAIGSFKERYGEKVTLYTIFPLSEPESFWSKEICGGPHVKETKTLGQFLIIKEEAVGSGIRRIKATLKTNNHLNLN